LHVIIDGRSLSIEQVVAVARGDSRKASPAQQAKVYPKVTLSGSARERIARASEFVESLLSRLLSHAAGVGELLPEEVVRAILLLRANALAVGCSGVRPEVVDTLIAMLNEGVHPAVPSQGSVGASGDLAPLAHAMLLLIGQGMAFYRGQLMPGAQAMAAAGISPVTLRAKEGLALINGTQVMTAIGVLAVHDAERLARVADIAAAMTTEALLGTTAALDPRIHGVRAHRGQQASAANILALMADSAIRRSHIDCPRVQDAYSLRCAPQVHGAVRDAIAYARAVVETRQPTAIP